MSMVREVPLANRRGLDLVALVDDEDYDRVAALSWNPLRTKSGRWYAVRARYGPERGAKRRLKRHQVYLHRFILDPPADVEVDHEDGDGLNCQRSNMRHATRAQNAANVGPLRTNTSGYKGVVRSPNSGSTWIAQIAHRTIGRYGTPEDAARAYDHAARARYGEFARLNFPDDHGLPPPRVVRGDSTRGVPRGARVPDGYADDLPSVCPSSVPLADWTIVTRRAAGESFAAIGASLGVSRQRAQQRERRAWARIRAERGEREDIAA